MSERAKNGRQLSEDNIRVIKNLFPDLYSLLTRIRLEEAFEIFERYRNHQFFCKDMEVLLSPKGRECVARELEMMREHARNGQNPIPPSG